MKHIVMFIFLIFAFLPQNKGQTKQDTTIYSQKSGFITQKIVRTTVTESGSKKTTVQEIVSAQNLIDSTDLHLSTEAMSMFFSLRNGDTALAKVFAIDPNSFYSIEVADAKTYVFYNKNGVAKMEEVQESDIPRLVLIVFFVVASIVVVTLVVTIARKDTQRKAQ